MRARNRLGIKNVKKNKGSLLSDKCLVFFFILLSTHALKGSSTKKEKRKKERDLKNQTTKRSLSSLSKYAFLRMPSSHGWEVVHLDTTKIAG
jgi:hypothetical protein